MGGENIPCAPLRLAEGHSHSGGTRSGVNHNSLAAPAAGATEGHAPSLELADPAAMPNRAAGPQAPPASSPCIPSGWFATTRVRRGRYRLYQEPSDTMIYLIITYAKHYLKGHGVGPTAIEISAGGQSDG